MIEEVMRAALASLYVSTCTVLAIFALEVLRFALYS
jgi:hypothetical protein